MILGVRVSCKPPGPVRLLWFLGRYGFRTCGLMRPWCSFRGVCLKDVWLMRVWCSLGGSDPALVAELLPQLGMLSSVYHLPPSAFTSSARPAVLKVFADPPSTSHASARLAVHGVFPYHPFTFVLYSTHSAEGACVRFHGCAPLRTLHIHFI